MKILIIILALIIGALWLATFFISRDIKSQFPPIGTIKQINGANLHYVETGAIDKPAVIFVHGAGGNLRDQMTAYKPLLENDYRLIFPDRPGQGYSARFENSYDPKEQAKSIALLMNELNIEEAIIAGHSFGGVVVSAFGVLYPEKTKGLILLAPVAYPWPGGVSWRYSIAKIPVIGSLFANLIATPAGSIIYPEAVKGVFAPNEMPEDYRETSGTRLALLPNAFLANGWDVASVEEHVEEFHPRYKEIKAPTYVFHGDKDTIVSLEIHSINGLSKDVEGAKLNVLEGVGHKPDYVASDQVVKAIREISAQ